jgi:chromosome segregation ATPase
MHELTDELKDELTESKGLVERLEAAATLLERTLGWLEEKQRFLSGEVDRISATVESSRREEELLARLEAVSKELEELRASGSAPAVEVLPKALQPLRRTMPTATVEMLAKHGIGESAVDVRTLDAAMSGLSLEQRIAVKSQLRRAGAVA